MNPHYEIASACAAYITYVGLVPSIISTGRISFQWYYTWSIYRSAVQQLNTIDMMFRRVVKAEPALGTIYYGDMNKLYIDE